MADASGAGADPLIAQLRDEIARLSFFQAVGLLEARFADAAPIGGTGPAAAERIQFRAVAGLGFPPAEIEDLEWRERGEGVEGASGYALITQPFIGLYGPSSPLPAFYTERVIARDEDHANERAFLDLFNHRLAALLYRVWKQYRYHVRFRPGLDDDISQSLLALTGLRPVPDGVDARRLLPYGGLLALWCRSAAVIGAVTGGYFQVPVRIEEAVAREVEIPPEQRNHLGKGYCLLGEELILGDRVPDIAGKIRVHVGPLDLAAFMDFLPGAPSFAELRALLAALLRDPLDFDFALHLAEGEAPAGRLGAPSCRLGLSAWLGTPAPGDEHALFGPTHSPMDAPW